MELLLLHHPLFPLGHGGLFPALKFVLRNESDQLSHKGINNIKSVLSFFPGVLELPSSTKPLAKEINL